MANELHEDVGGPTAVHIYPRVLLIDDDEGTRTTFTAILKLAGCAVVSEASAANGLQLVRETSPDLVICDLELPGVTALDLLRTLRLSGVAVRFVIITGFGSVAAAFEAARLGAVQFLEKPVIADSLLDCVRRYTSQLRGTPVQPSTELTRRLAAVIEQNYSNPNLNVRSLARALGVSAEHLCRTVRADNADTVAELLRSVRVREAERLLTSSDAPIKEIAARVGFKSTSQLDRHFKRVHGTGPVTFRRAAAERADRHVD